MDQNIFWELACYMYPVLFNPLLDLSLPLFNRNGPLPCHDLHLPYSYKVPSPVATATKGLQKSPACEAGQQQPSKLFCRKMSLPGQMLLI